MAKKSAAKKDKRSADTPVRTSDSSVAAALPASTSAGARVSPVDQPPEVSRVSPPAASISPEGSADTPVRPADEAPLSPISTAVSVLPAVDQPAEVPSSSPPQASLSQVTPPNAGADTVNVDGIGQPQPELITPVEVQPRPFDEVELDKDLQDEIQAGLDQRAAKDAEIRDGLTELFAPKARLPDPEIIAQASQYQTGHGKPAGGLPRYHLPQPPKLR